MSRQLFNFTPRISVEKVLEETNLPTFSCRFAALVYKTFMSGSPPQPWPDQITVSVSHYLPRQLLISAHPTKGSWKPFLNLVIFSLWKKEEKEKNKTKQIQGERMSCSYPTNSSRWNRYWIWPPLFLPNRITTHPSPTSLLNKQKFPGKKMAIRSSLANFSKLGFWSFMFRLFLSNRKDFVKNNQDSNSGKTIAWNAYVTSGLMAELEKTK